MKARTVLVTTSTDPVPFRGEAEFRDLVERIVEFELEPDALNNAEVIVAGKWTPEMNAAAPNARWLNLWTAGLDSAVIPEVVKRGVLVTHSSGIHAPKIAAHVMACVLMFACRMPFYLRAQIEGEWRQESQGYDDLTGKTLSIVGLGRIGEALAVRARSFGMNVIATKRDLTTRYDPSIMIDAMYPATRLPEMIAESDHVCITMRYTPESHHLFDAAMLSHFKPDAYLHNTARGKIVDEPALIVALKQGRIRGASLDVFEMEPLSQESPLWTMENVILTPHVAGFNPHYFKRAAHFFTVNFRRYVEGRTLNNLYEAQRGY